MRTLLVGVPELVRLHLTEPEHSVLALVAVVVGLLPVVGAPAAAGAVLRRRRIGSPVLECFRLRVFSASRPG